MLTGKRMFGMHQTIFYPVSPGASEQPAFLLSSSFCPEMLGEKRPNENIQYSLCYCYMMPVELSVEIFPSSTLQMISQPLMEPVKEMKNDKVI